MLLIFKRNNSDLGWLVIKYLKVSDLIFYIPLTILMIYDYFPDTSLSNIIPRNINIWIILSLYLISILFKRFRRPNNIENIKGQVITLIYLFSVMLVLTILGGKSTSGIGLNNIGVWVTLAISIGEIVSQKRKLESSKSKTDIQNF